MGLSSDAAERIRRATRLGKPLGSQEFVRQLQATAGHPVSVGPCSRPPIARSVVAHVAQQESLFAE